LCCRERIKLFEAVRVRIGVLIGQRGVVKVSMFREFFKIPFLLELMK
jgi:hypothetical protein